MRENARLTDFNEAEDHHGAGHVRGAMGGGGDVRVRGDGEKSHTHHERRKSIAVIIALSVQSRVLSSIADIIHSQDKRLTKGITSTMLFVNAMGQNELGDFSGGTNHYMCSLEEIL